MSDGIFAKPQSKNKIELLEYDEAEKITDVKIYELEAFKDHPFKVLEDDNFAQLKESIEENGVTTPIIVRKKENGNYEIIAGHRRAKACELIGLITIPAIIRDLDDVEATLFMVDTNIQRESILPSEKAFAYKMKLDALKRKAGRPANNGVQVEPHLKSRDLLAQNTEDSSAKIQRFIRLTELIPDFLDFIDNKKLPFITGVELSYLTPSEQEEVNQTMVHRGLVPSLEQASQMKKISKESKLNLTQIESILVPREKATTQTTVKVDQTLYFLPDTPKKVVVETVHTLLENHSKQRQYFAKETTAEEMVEITNKLLEEWSKNNSSSQDTTS